VSTAAVFFLRFGGSFKIWTALMSSKDGAA
jgi:hypothetical protein